MIGSMGLASSIGLGVALVQPHRRVLVLDGDGNLLMNLGALATIAAARPPNHSRAPALGDRHRVVARPAVADDDLADQSGSGQRRQGAGQLGRGVKCRDHD